MKKIALLALSVLILVGCKSFEDLEAGNALAIENQKNLESNVIRAFDNLKKAAMAYAVAAGKEWTEEDEAIWSASKNEAIFELATNRAWLLVLDGAIKNDSLNADLLGSVVSDLPEWIKEGKDLYDLIKAKSKEE